MNTIQLQRKKIVLVGNPNVGKSTLFNALTGQRQHTGNWAGKTVAVASGPLRSERGVLLVDLPGMYSLYGTSEDERIAAAYLTGEHIDGAVVVCDGCALQRNMILALQIMELCSNVILCVNLMDEAHRQGIQINGSLLEEKLGVPVVFTSGSQKSGLSQLKDQMCCMLNKPVRKQSLSGDPVQIAKQVAQSCIVKKETVNENWRLVLDRILVSPRRGFEILGVLLMLILWITVWGANYPGRLLETVFLWIYDRLNFLREMVPYWLSGILLDGIYTTVSRVVSVMLPPVLIFFPLFTLLEDVGYLPRLAFLLERGMRRCGGCGKQALTLCMGLGCNAVGVTGCRIIASPRQRLIAILTNAMIPCNGRFPVMILLATLFFGDVLGSFLVAACIVLGVGMSMVCTWILSRYVLSREPDEKNFLMEIPPLRCPQMKTVLLHSIFDRSLHVAVRAVVAAAPAGAVLWILENTASLTLLCAVFDPVGRILGMNGQIIVSFILSLPANELFLPILLSCADGISETALPMTEIDGTMAICIMVFMLFHWPCATTLLTIKTETGSWKKTAAAALLPTAVGVILCLILNLLF